MLRACLCFMLAGAAPVAAPAQDKDFLTSTEIEVLRDTQEIPARLQLYLKFAEQRLDRLDATFKLTKAGRSGLLHDLLEQYGKIVDAIDAVVEDALRRDREIDSVALVAEAEKKMLVRLEAWRDSQPHDIARYQFVLDTAIDSTRDSIEMNQEDLKDRKRTVGTQDQKEKKEREAMRTSEAPSKEGAKDAATKAEETKDPAKAPRKAPTLYKKGEKPEEKKQP